MTSQQLNRRWRVLALVVLLAALYAWAATDVAPFTVPAYVLVALPAVTVVLLLVRDGTLFSRGTDVSASLTGTPTTLRTVTPWLVVLVLALALEAIGLSLGGRSSRVPTLSTTLDHLLVTHWLRGVLFFLWLAIGVLPLRHRASRTGRG